MKTSAYPAVTHTMKIFFKKFYFVLNFLCYEKYSIIGKGEMSSIFCFVCCESCTMCCEILS